MKNDIYKSNFKKLSSVTLFPIPSYTYVPNMVTLSQNMTQEWSHLRCLDWNLYMFIDDWAFCEVLFWKVCNNSSLLFLLATSTHKRTPCRRISSFDVFFIFFEFFQKKSKWRAWLFVEIGRFFQNYRRFYKQSLFVYLKVIFLKFSEETITHL